ncbi:AraC family transcriptional regulator [Sphingobacterium wenxiniae]|uniref:AraC-type DNA-binding protein n=1 Tax=Sphingobacterium wenxiniae TaxID=683125 RepID=A0A1I6PHI3_9SPHI|nr:helix-turn-helix domain-containing protein [Sphingobacterium wenxiniae]SFS39672.1 AraC-type DNA-binding protein [Sphingobacterium wenxiniae]
MKKSLHFGLHDYFEIVSSIKELTQISPKLRLRHSAETYWKQQNEEAILQEFDGYFGFLYYLEILLEETRVIPLEVDKSDLHILYLLSSSGMVTLMDDDTKPIVNLRSSRASYLYLPPEEYTLCLPEGRSQLFGLYFRSKIFRMGNERPYDFLQPLLSAYHSDSPAPMVSKDFRIGPRTRLSIEALARDLQAKQLNNEGFILDKLIKLIELSKDKVGEEENKTHYELRLAEQAQQLIGLYVEQEGQMANLKNLEKDLNITLASINRMHLRYFGKTLRTLRDRLLIDRACTFLRSGFSPTQCAYILNYNSPEAFYHFFKRKTGLSPASYIKINVR